MILIVSAYSCQPKIVNPLTEKSERVRFVAEKTHFIDTITNLSGYLTNGNTPEGVFSLQGFGSSDIQFIGKSPTIITALPFEIPPDKFT